MTKWCSKCNKDKLHNEFSKRSAAKDGLQLHCKLCSSEKFSNYYNDNKDHHLCVVKANKRSRISRLKGQLIEYLSSHPCVDCGESDPAVLEFDHVIGEKRSAVASMIHDGVSWEVITQEIGKCQVRCANCHRRITYVRSGSYRMSMPL